MSTPANALAHETSPYLLQHAHNPVHWYPWGPEALERARREDRPILLSVGYSACHWCHVMAHESFEDEETAGLMNELFVNVKVDREERPDLDRIYQTAHQLLAQRPGGWPLTMFITPGDLTPFFGGTYFPRESRHGLPGFKYVLRRMAEIYQTQRDEIRTQNAALMQALGSLEPEPPGADTHIDPMPLEVARRELAQSFDRGHGGFGRAPKFPHATSLERLLRHYAATATNGRPDTAALEVVDVTLRRMALGGIYDQLAGGFCRYSVDDQWMIPHFEKMLYDNGPLLALYAEAWQLTGDPLYRRVASESGGWVMREMQSPEGGYYSSLDADSEGEEGRYYVWDRSAVQALLPAQEYAVFARRFGLDRLANFEGHWHLHAWVEVADVARRLHITEAEAEGLLDAARARLLAERERRIRPGRDEKVLTSWNGLMIRGMATAGRILGEPRLVESAERALDFVRATLWKDGRLLATGRDGRAHLSAYLDDYAFLIDGVLALLQARWRDADLRLAVDLAGILLESFEDRQAGGFFFTSHQHERLIQRPKPLGDESLPSGNGIAAQVLGRLGHVLGETHYLEAAERTLKLAWGSVQRLPYGHCALLTAAEEYLYPPRVVVLRGEGPRLAEWQARCQRDYAPRSLTLAIPTDAGYLPGMLAERRPRGPVVAYLCEGTRCSAPITDLAELDAALGPGPVRPDPL